MTSVIILMAGLSAMLADGSKSDASLEERWRREYPSAAAEWEEAARHVWAKGETSFRFKSGDILIAKDLHVAASGDKKLSVRDQRSSVSREKPNAPGRPLGAVVQCETEEYKFTITKAVGATDFLIEDYRPREDVEADVLFQMQFERYTKNATVFRGTSILERMRAPSFVLKSIAASEQDGDELVRITYSYEGEHVLENGFFDLDPGKSWAIRRVDVKTRRKDSEHTHGIEKDVQYRKVDGVRFFPTRMEYYSRIKEPDVYEHIIVEYDDVRLGPPPDKVFKLSAYGLPDVPLRPLPRASIFTFANPLLWLTFAASVVSFVLLWYLRPREANPA
mgnify:CR=1 FL=1